MQHLLLAIAGGSCCVASSPASAQPRGYKLAPQPLATALTALASQSGRNILFAPDMTAGRITRQVSGARSVTAALDALLRGTGLVYVIEKDRSITIVPAARRTARKAPPPVITGRPAGDDMDIVVTAQRREQRRADVPMALSVFSARRLETLGVREFDRLSLFTPGLVIEANSPMVSSFSMRGITQNSGDSTREPRVSIFQDGVSISAARGAYVELFDIERLEVARGPQSTLYGRAAMTGALNIVQNKASFAGPGWRGEIERGNRGQQLVEAMANLPLSETTAVRIVGRVKQRDGYVTNRLGSEKLGSIDTEAGRAMLRWQPDPDLTVDLIGNVEHNAPSGTPYRSIRYAPADPVSGQMLGNLRRGFAMAVAADGIAGGRPLGLDRTIGSVTALVDARVNDGIRLSSTSAWRHFAGLSISDQDGMALPIYAYAEEARGTLFSQELRLSFEKGDHLAGFAGISLQDEAGRQRTLNQFDERLMLAQLSGRIDAPHPQPLSLLTELGFVTQLLQERARARGITLSAAAARTVAEVLGAAYREQNVNFSHTRSLDLFGDLTWTPIPQVQLTAGFRVGRDHKRSAISASLDNGPSILGGFLQAIRTSAADRDRFLADPRGATGGFLFQPTAGNGDMFARTMDDTGVSWRTVARYAPWGTLSFYGSYAKGRRPAVLVAGPPAVAGGAARFARVPAETVNSFELGGRYDEAGGRFTLDGALYHYRYRNFQTTVFEDGTLRSTNAGRANAYGVELQLQWLPDDALAFTGTYSFNHARFASGEYRGNRFRLAPDHRLSLGATWQWSIGGGHVALTPTFSWQSLQFFNDNNDLPGLGGGLIGDSVQDEFQPPHGTIDLRLSFAPARSRWRLAAFVTNLLDQIRVKDAGVLGDGLGLPTLVAAAPRLWGLNLSLQH